MLHYVTLSRQNKLEMIGTAYPGVHHTGCENQHWGPDKEKQEPLNAEIMLQKVDFSIFWMYGT